MHTLFVFGALWHATALAVIGFFVLFTASRSAGFVKTIGNLLGGWLFILAVLAVIGAAVAPTFGDRIWGSRMMGYRHGQMMGSYPPRWMESGWPPAASPPEAAPASAPPANK